MTTLGLAAPAAMDKKRADWLLPFLLALAAIGLALLLLASGFSKRQALAGAIVAFTMSSWATNALPEVSTGLVFFALSMVGGVAEPRLVFTGFAASAFWLVLGGMVIAQAMTRTGLGQRIARSIAAPLSTSYLRLIIGTVLITYGLAFIMPSNIGRITLLMPIMLSIADHLGLGEGRAGRSGIVLAVGFGTFILSTTILPANVPNLVMAGSIEALLGLHLSYPGCFINFRASPGPPCHHHFLIFTHNSPNPHRANSFGCKLLGGCAARSRSARRVVIRSASEPPCALR